MSITIRVSYTEGEMTHELMNYISTDDFSRFPSEPCVWDKQTFDGLYTLVPLSWLGVPGAMRRGFTKYLPKQLVEDYLTRAEKYGWYPYDH